MDVNSLFDTIAGLPVHPLVVHFAVVLLPLATFGVLLSIFIPKIRTRYLGLSVFGVFLGTGAAFVAKESGAALAQRIGLPARHADLGDKLFLVSVFFLALSLIWFRFNNRVHWRGKNFLTAITALSAIAVITLSVITGHTGAEAVWQNKLQPASKSATTNSVSPDSVSMQKVTQHNSPSDCWSAINGSVYDLTQWINKHPGGAGVIKGLCGKDGSAGFTAQHGGKSRPESELSRFLVGALAK